jgi:hypothetical protein
MLIFVKVAWANGDGSITLEQVEGDEGVQPIPTSQQSDLKLNETTSKINENNRFIVEFTRPRKVKGSTIKTKQNFAYAYGSLSPEAKDIGTYLPRHDFNGNIKLNLAEGTSELSLYDNLIVAHGKYRYVI